MPRFLPWEQLQEDVRRELEKVDGKASITKGSGNVKGDGDVISKNFMVECKLRSTDGFTINIDTFNKIQEEAKLRGRVPILANRNKSGDTLITLTFKDFIKMIKYYENKNM